MRIQWRRSPDAQAPGCKLNGKRSTQHVKYPRVGAIRSREIVRPCEPDGYDFRVHVGEIARLAQEAYALKIKAAGEGKLMNITDELKKEITPTKGKGQKNVARRKRRAGSGS